MTARTWMYANLSWMAAFVVVFTYYGCSGILDQYLKKLPVKGLINVEVTKSTTIIHNEGASKQARKESGGVESFGACDIIYIDASIERGTCFYKCTLLYEFCLVEARRGNGCMGQIKRHTEDFATKQWITQYQYRDKYLTLDDQGRCLQIKNDCLMECNHDNG